MRKLVVVLSVLVLLFATQSASAGSFRSLVSFKGGKKSGLPNSGLTVFNGLLYGVTPSGGKYNGGVIFTFDPTTRKEAIVYDFGKGGDGFDPQASLAVYNGLLYGTTTLGGASDAGTVFQFDPATGQEQPLYSFLAQNDGSNPVCTPVFYHGVLYGTTYQGGGANTGTIFKLDLSDNIETMLFDFPNSQDGGFPVAGLILEGGLLYGTTSGGGAGSSGTVFQFDPRSAAETLLYSFGGGTDGNTPDASLTYASGVLVGTTKYGGASGDGTLFAVDPGTGGETVLYAFSGADGANPQSPVLLHSGELYGTTAAGGAAGDGVAFAFDLGTAAERTLHGFDGADGSQPIAGLTSAGSRLYGVAYAGGRFGNGTIFSLKR